MNICNEHLDGVVNRKNTNHNTNISRTIANLITFPNTYVKLEGKRIYKHFACIFLLNSITSQIRTIIFFYVMDVKLK